MSGTLTSPSDTSLQKRVTLLPGAFLPCPPPHPPAPSLVFAFADPVAFA